MRVHAAGLNGADMMQRRGLTPRRPDHRRTSRAGVRGGGRRARDGATRFPVGRPRDGGRRRRRAAGFAVVHERQLMPVPDALDWAAAGGLPEVFTRPRRGVRAGGVARGRAAARARRRRWRRHRRGPARPRRGRASHSDRAHRGAARAGRRAGRAAIAPEGFAEHGPFDVILELVGAPNLSPRTSRRSPPVGGSR